MATARVSIAPRILSQTICRRCMQTAARRPFVPWNERRSAVRNPILLHPPIAPVRRHSAPASNSRIYEFEQIKRITEAPSPDLILIDVREPAEVQQGYIPTAINIPIKSQPDALMLPEDEFEDRFGFSKPEVDKEVVFYCRSGVRSNAAALLAQQHGYQNVAEYRGSWLDWQEKGGVASKP